MASARFGAGPAVALSPLSPPDVGETPMPLDVAALATTVVSRFLLPYAKLGLERIGTEVRKRADDTVEKQAIGVVDKVWKKVASLFTSDEERFLIRKMESSPDKVAPLFEDVLREKLEQSPEAARELDELVSTPIAAGGGVSVKDVLGDVGVFVAHGSTFSGGQQAGLIKNTGGSSRPPEATDQRTAPSPGEA
jgi:hypothetical protein